MHELQQGLHRRGLKRFNKRVYTPTAVFGPDPATSTTPLFPGLPATTTQPTTPATIPATPSTPATVPPTTTALPTTTAPATPTTSSPATTAPTTTAPATPTTPTTTAPATTTSAPSKPTLKDVTTEVDVTITASKSPSSSASALAASPTQSAEPSQMSTGVVVGGIIAAIVAVAGLVFLIVYFVRRSRSAKEDDASGDDYNSDAWKRQSTMLPDDGPYSVPRAMNYSRNGARPPTMIEQKLAGGMPFNAPPPMHSHHPYGAAGYGSFSPGQVVSPYTQSPTTTNSANPFFSPYGDSPMGSPVSSVPAYESAYDAHGNLISRHPSMASTAVLSRHTSVASKQEPTADGQYVEMNRSSVTPFQAAQYAEISRRLNSTPPQALPLAAVSEEMEHGQEIEVPAQGPVKPLELQPASSLVEGHRLNVQPTPREHSFPESPFADPNMIAEQGQHIPRRDSTDSMLQVPEPAKARVTSIPPTLPEIRLQERAFSPVTMEFPSSVRPSPSPFSTSFNLPSPPANAHFHEAAEPAAAAAAAAPRATARVPAVKRPETVYTLYDEEDAYAGI